MIKQWKAGTGKLILIVTLFSLISACGFHLRGIQDVSEDKKLVILTPGNTDNQLLRSLRRNMKFNGITEAANANYQIRLSNFRYKRRAATISSSADVDEYEILVEVSMLILDRQGQPLTQNIKIQRDRIYTYDKDAAAASSEQEELLRGELYDSIAQTILRRYLASNNTQQ
ncbi:LPS assembly lipoprotein LptE [Neptuniibacter pectenicola]|uniref:LPS-assembly lipoprotein LptE n=1 Tax=Neptuniibacter pectenicola TaxID=1806669 RepID=UPI0030EE1D0D